MSVEKPRAHGLALGTVLAVVWTVGLLVALPAGVLRAQSRGPVREKADRSRTDLIVRLTYGDTAAKLDAVRARIGYVGIKSYRTVDGLYTVRLRPGLSVEEAARIVKELDGVAYAEPNYIVRTQVTPNDPSFGDLWGLQNTGQLGGLAGADIQAADAWGITTGSSSVVVVGIDTGVDYTHPDLVANLFRNEADCNTNGVDDDGNGVLDDCFGIDTANDDSDPRDDNDHGTHISGTIGATGNNSAGVAGVNWNVKMMTCKFLDASGDGFTSDAIDCLEYVALMKDRGVNIIATNNSWGGAGFSQALVDAIDAQRQRGILFIAAAGNDTLDNDAEPHYPANIDLPNVIAVASTTRTDSRSGFSNTGRRTVHIGAPGSEILSTTRTNVPADAAHPFGFFSGTSMATPHVTGVAALLKAQDPGRDWRTIRSLILAGGDDNANLAAHTLTGKRLNAFGSMTCSGVTGFSRLKPIQNTVTTSVGAGVTISGLNISCVAASSDVSVTVTPGGQVVTLKDDGVAPDQVAGDGQVAGSFVPASTGLFVLTFPNGETAAVKALSSTSYTVAPTTTAFRTITGTNLNLADDTSAQITSTFPILFAGSSFRTVFVGSNGNISFSPPVNAFINGALPAAASGSLVAPWWDDLTPAGAQNVFWEITGAAPNRELVIEWRNVAGASCLGTDAVTFQVVFFEGFREILFRYSDVTFGASCSFRNAGAAATVGVQTSSAIARQFSLNTASLSDGLGLLFTHNVGTPAGFTDDPLIGASTMIKAVHFNELRSRVDTLRLRFGLAAAAWTDPTLSSAIPVKAAHVNELRTALAEAYTAAAESAPGFTDPTLVTGSTTVRGLHIKQLRDAVVVLESI